MNQSRSLSDLSLTELRKVLTIKEQIADLEQELSGVFGGKTAGRKALAAVTEAAPVTKRGRRGGRRKMSAEARERIAAAQRARWAKQRGGKAAPEAKAPKAAKAPKKAGKRGGKRQLSPEARERIAAAQRARWAAVRKKG
jgi:hypothetical protein